MFIYSKYVMIAESTFLCGRDKELNTVYILTYHLKLILTILSPNQFSTLMLFILFYGFTLFYKLLVNINDKINQTYA